MEKSPLATQTRRERLTLPVDWRTPVGETKIPLPMMQPMMTVQPFIRVISAFSLIPSSSFSPVASATESISSSEGSAFFMSS